MTNSKAQKDEEKKRENLRKSPPFIQVNQASGLCKQSRPGHEDSFYFDVEINMNFSSPSLNVTGCNVPRWELEGCTKARPIAQGVII